MKYESDRSIRNYNGKIKNYTDKNINLPYINPQNDSYTFKVPKGPRAIKTPNLGNKDGKNPSHLFTKNKEWYIMKKVH